MGRNRRMKILHVTNLISSPTSSTSNSIHWLATHWESAEGCVHQVNIINIYMYNIYIYE